MGQATPNEDENIARRGSATGEGDTPGSPAAIRRGRFDSRAFLGTRCSAITAWYTSAAITVASCIRSCSWISSSTSRFACPPVPGVRSCVELAVVVGEEPVAELLRNTLEEEEAADLLLTDVANEEVNPKAMHSSEKATVS